jgi:chloramphenicol-sensitive protein RarD
VRAHESAVSQARTGYLLGIGAYLCWGLFPLYWKLLRPASPLEILAHRIVWSCVFVAVVVTIGRRWRPMVSVVRTPRTLALVSVAAVVIAVNWGTYIYGVNSDQIVETALGYFINPLVTVLLGVGVLRESLRPAQWVAVGIGASAVGVLTVDYGRVPYIALILAFSFGCYGLVKKRLAVPAADGLLVESAALAVPALAYLIVLSYRSEATFTSMSAGHTVLLVLAGAVTAVPLLLFAGAANRIPLSSIGLLQYLAPSLQLACGVLVFGEPMPFARLVGFILVWIALALFTWDGLRQFRARSASTLTGVQPTLTRV